MDSSSPMPPRLHRLLHSLVRPTSPLRLRLFENAFVFSLACYLGERFLHLDEWLTEAGFHYTAENYYASDGEPLPLLPTWAAYLLCLTFYAAVAAFFLNWHRRIMLCWILVIAIYVNFADTASAAALNRVYIIILSVLVLPRSRTG
jgi:hypothetical protein